MALQLELVGRGPWASRIERTLLSFPDVSVTRIGRHESPPAGCAGVLIASESATHAEVALRYIEAGVKTFIEKPMTTTVADAERIRAAAERSGTAVFVGHIYLHHPAFLAALDVLPSLGEIRYVLCEGMNDRPRATPRFCGTGSPTTCRWPARSSAAIPPTRRPGASQAAGCPKQPW